MGLLLRYAPRAVASSLRSLGRLLQPYADDDNDDARAGGSFHRPARQWPGEWRETRPILVQPLS